MLAKWPDRVASLTMISTTQCGWHMAAQMMKRPWVTLKVYPLLGGLDTQTWNLTQHCDIVSRQFHLHQPSPSASDIVHRKSTPACTSACISRPEEGVASCMLALSRLHKSHDEAKCSYLQKSVSSLSCQLTCGSLLVSHGNIYSLLNGLMRPALHDCQQPAMLQGNPVLPMVL